MALTISSSSHRSLWGEGIGWFNSKIQTVQNLPYKAMGIATIVSYIASRWLQESEGSADINSLAVGSLVATTLSSNVIQQISIAAIYLAGRAAAQTVSHINCLEPLLFDPLMSSITTPSSPLVLGWNLCQSSQSLASSFQLGDPFLVTSPEDSPRFPCVAPLPNGTVAIIWQRSTIEGCEVCGGIFSLDGKRIGSNFSVGTSSQDMKAPMITSLRDGSFIVAWQRDEGLYAQRLSPTGTKIETEFLIATLPKETSFALTTVNTGTLVVTWQGEKGVYAQLFSPSGSKIATPFQVSGSTTTGRLAPTIATLTSGNFVIAWQGQCAEGTSCGIAARLFSPSGKSMGNEFLIGNRTAVDQEAPSVQTLPNGNFVISWQVPVEDGSGYGIYSQIFSQETTPVGNAFLVNQDTNGDQVNPKIAAMANGNFIVTWKSWEQSRWMVYGQVFGFSGTKIGSPFSIGSQSLGSQDFPLITALPNNTFIVTWENYDDQSSNQIYAQRFFSPPGLLVPSPKPVLELPFSKDVVQTSQTVAKISSVVSLTSLSPGGVAQSSRMSSLMRVIGCQNGIPFEPENPSIDDNPTRLVIGDSSLRYALGTVVGNEALFLGLSTIAAILSSLKDAETIRAPGVLVVPVLFLSTSTATSATTLLRFGGTIEQSIGGSMFALHALGILGVGVVLSSSHFEANRTEGNKWRDLHNNGYVHRYGYLFKDYRAGYQQFVVVELLMTMASGVLQSFQNQQKDCGVLTATAASVYGVYAAAMIICRPHEHPVEKGYFTTIAVAQFVPIAMKAIDSRTESVAASVLVCLKYTTLLRGLFDAAMMIKSLNRVRAKQKPKKREVENRDETQNARLLPDIDVEKIGQDTKRDREPMINPLDASIH